MEGSAVYFLLRKEQKAYGYCIQPFLTTKKVYECTVSGCEFAALLGPAKPVILKEHTCRAETIEPVQKASIHFISEQFDRIIVQVFNGTPYSETIRDIPKMMRSSVVSDHRRTHQTALREQKMKFNNLNTFPLTQHCLTRSATIQKRVFLETKNSEGDFIAAPQRASHKFKKKDKTFIHK